MRQGLSYLRATVSRFADGRLGEIFLTNHNAGSAADTAARDAAIACSIALQFGADMETIRKALCRDSRGNASGPLGVALDVKPCSIVAGASRSKPMNRDHAPLRDRNPGADGQCDMGSGGARARARAAMMDRREALLLVERLKRRTRDPEVLTLCGVLRT